MKKYISSILVSAAADSFIKSQTLAGLKPASTDAYQRALQVIIDMFGDLPLAALSTASLQQALATAQTPSVKQTYYNVWSAFLNWASGEGYVQSNPAELLLRPAGCASGIYGTLYGQPSKGDPGLAAGSG